MNAPLIVAVGALLGCGSMILTGFSTAAGQQDSKHRTAPLQRSVGVTLPSHVTAIAPEQAGTIVDLPVGEGDVVERGKVVFRLSSKLQRLRVDRLITLTNSDLSVRRALATFEHSSRLKDRLAELS